jgi:transposase-like protein
MDKAERRELAREEVHARKGVKAVIEQVRREHLGAAQQERAPLRRGWRNNHSTGDLITPPGKLEQLRVPKTGREVRHRSLRAL